jgi:organic hydroperoxide reductase OsmC/OhrA
MYMNEKDVSAAAASSSEGHISRRDGLKLVASRSALTRRASVPNLDQDTSDRLARDAERNCPVSRVLKTEITLDAQLVF